MLSKIISAAAKGVDGFIVDVEVNIDAGVPSFEIVGLPDAAVKEARDRVKAAIRNSGYIFPNRRITVNLAPADSKKEGSAFDLPIAVGILSAMGMLQREKLQGSCFLGELSLDGAAKPIKGALPMALAFAKAGMKRIFLPADNASEAALVESLKVFPVNCLSDIVKHFEYDEPIGAFERTQESFDLRSFDIDFSDVKGQSIVKRALEVAAAGGHNVLIIGPPGTGKSMLASRLVTIMPPLTLEESLEVTKVHSVAGLLPRRGGRVYHRPFRSVHHTATTASLSGGGVIPRPGEISLAHHGILYLDELPEFSTKTLDSLRQPLENGEITINRVNAVITYPARFMLVAGMNPCPCGYYGSTGVRKCSCRIDTVSKYLQRISGPFLDRIDIQIEAANIEYSELSKTGGESSAVIAERVRAARDIAVKRFEGLGISANAHMTPSMFETFCKLGEAERAMMNIAFDRLGLNTRGYHKILKMARTIADLDNNPNIEKRHLSEALTYRTLDRKYFG